MIWLFLKQFFEYLGGEADEPPWQQTPSRSTFVRQLLGALAWGAWWCILLLVILFFCGQSSKFIYIDF